MARQIRFRKRFKDGSDFDQLLQDGWIVKFCYEVDGVMEYILEKE